MLDRFTVPDKVAIITGGGRGIGAAAARVLAGAGADAVLTARTPEQLKVVAEGGEGAGSAGAGAAGRRERARRPIDDIVARTIEEFGGVDIVVNNAGGTMPRPFLDTSAGFMERAFHFNVTAAFALTKAATPSLLEPGRRGEHHLGHRAAARPRASSRTAPAKSALTHMTRMLAARPRRRRYTWTRHRRGLHGHLRARRSCSNDRAARGDGAARPLRRLGDPEDIALGVLYLASPTASWITGKILRSTAVWRRPTWREARPARPLTARPGPAPVTRSRECGPGRGDRRGSRGTRRR